MKSKAVGEDDDEPRKMRSSRSKRRRYTRRASSTESESPPRRRSKKPGKRTPPDKKSKRSKVSSRSRRRRRSPSPSPSLSSSSSPSSVSCSTCSSSSSEQSVSPPPPRSRSRDVKKGKGRGRDSERRKARRSTSASSSTSSSSGSRSRNKSSKRWTKYGTKRDKSGRDYKNTTDSFDRDDEALVAAKDCGTQRHEKNVSLEKTENPPSKSANETEDVLTAAAGGSPVAENLELILRHKALENFIKFRAAAMAGKTDNAAAQKETLTDSPQNASTKVTEARSASITPFPRHLGARHPTESPKSEDRGNGTSPWMRNSSTGMSHEAGSHSTILKDGDTGGPTQQEGSITKATHSTSQCRSPQDGRNSRNVFQRLVHTPGSASSVTQRLGSSVGVQASGLGARNPTESPKSEDHGNGTSPWMRNSSAGMSHEAGSHSRIHKDGGIGRPTQQEGSITKATHSTSQHRSPQDGRNRRSVMERLVRTPGSASSVTQRLGSSVGVSHVNAVPRIKSVVSIPAREELDGSSSSTPQRPCEKPAPVESSDDVRYTSIDISTEAKAEGTNGDGRKTSEPSAPNSSVLSSADGKTQVTEPRIEDTEGSQLQKKTFSRMHDGETVEVSYKVYIPKKTPALARRKLQR